VNNEQGWAVKCGYLIFHLCCILAEVLVLCPGFSYNDMYRNGEIVCTVYFECIMDSYFLPKQNFPEVLFFTKVFFKIKYTLIMYLFIYYKIPQLSPFFDMVMLLVSVVGCHICYTVSTLWHWDCADNVVSYNCAKHFSHCYHTLICCFGVCKHKVRMWCVCVRARACVSEWVSEQHSRLHKVKNINMKALLFIVFSYVKSKLYI